MQGCFEAVTLIIDFSFFLSGAKASLQSLLLMSVLVAGSFLIVFLFYLFIFIGDLRRAQAGSFPETILRL